MKARLGSSGLEVRYLITYGYPQALYHLSSYLAVIRPLESCVLESWRELPLLSLSTKKAAA